MENIQYTDCWYKDVCKETDTCSEHCRDFLWLKYQMENCGLPVAKQKPIKLSLPQDEDRSVYTRLVEIKKDIVPFVKNGQNLYICGRYTGNGKTSWAIKLLHTYLANMAEGNHGNPKGMFVSVPDILLKLKDFENPMPLIEKERLKNIDLVVWDDIAVTEISRYDYLQLYNIINYRVFAEKTNIFTSNLISKKQLTDMLGDRLTSRIWNVSEVIEFKGKDVR